MDSSLPNFENFCAGYERSDLQDLADRLEAYFGPQRAFLTNPEIWSLKEFKGNGYRKINELLRTGSVKGASDAEIEDLEDTIEHLNSALLKGSLPFSTVVYRGLRRGYPPSTLAIGDYLDEPAFMSTTLSAAFARQICQWESNNIRSTILEISVPAGTNAIWLEGLVNKDEHELLLSSDTIIHISAIKDVEGYPGRRYVQCQCVQT